MLGVIHARTLWLKILQVPLKFLEQDGCTFMIAHASSKRRNPAEGKMEELKLVVDSVWVEDKEHSIFGVAMRDQSGHERLSFHVTRDEVEKYQVLDIFRVSIEKIC